MREHPTPLDLERAASGETMPEVVAHLETCEPCMAHVGTLREGVRAFIPEHDFVKNLRARQAQSTEPARGTLAATKRPLLAGRRWAAVVGPLAMAAGVIFYVYSSGDPGRARGPEAGAEEDGRLKGGLGLAVIRDRAGVQDRFTSTCQLAPGDRVRLEVVTDRPRTLVTGVLSFKGEWIELDPPRALARGTHLTTTALRVDPDGLAGYAVVGELEAVERGKRGDWRGVVRLTLEGAPR